MRSFTEQVDDFIEGMVNGSIISIMQKREGGPFIKDITIINYIAEIYDKLFKELIPHYLPASQETKQQMALEMLQIIMKLRMFGVIENSPISLSELQFLRHENTRLREDKKAMEEKVSDLSAKLTLSVPADTKVGVT
ncbi:MAG: hypothetical protein WAM14_05205 [Candidatus Nitrosopolaris sp.]